MSDTLEKLAAVIEQRKQADPESSYVAGLYARVIAAKGGDRDALVHETADLWFHTLVMLAERGLGPGDILAELESRFGLSGLDEKAARGSR